MIYRFLYTHIIVIVICICTRAHFDAKVLRLHRLLQAKSAHINLII